MNMLLAVIYNQFRGYFQVNSHTSNKSVTCNQSLRLVKLIKNDRRIRNKSSENILLQGYKWFSLCPIFSLLFLLKKSWKSNTSFSLMALSQVSCNAVLVLGLQTSMQSDLLRRRVGVRAAYEVLKETDRYSNISHAGLRSGHISCLSMMISTHDLNIHLGMQISTPDLKIHPSTSSQH